MIHVGAAVIEKDDRVLICQRSEGGSCAFLWEFPGGKQEPGESMRDCVIRECREELGIGICVTGLLDETIYKYPEREIHFTFFRAVIMEGNIDPRVHKEVKWVNYSEFDSYEFCPADVEIVRKLQSLYGGME